MSKLLQKLSIVTIIILIIIPPFTFGFCVSEDSLIGEVVLFCIIIAEMVFLYHNIYYYMCLENKVEVLEKELEQYREKIEKLRNKFQDIKKHIDNIEELNKQLFENYYESNEE